MTTTMFATGLRFSLIWAAIGMVLADNICGVPPDLPNAEIIHSEQEIVIYKCQSNLNITIKCQKNHWVIPKIKCPEESRNGEGNVNDTVMSVGNSSVSFYENGTNDRINATFIPDDIVFCNDSNAENRTCKLHMELNDSSLCIDGLINGTNISCIYNNSEDCPEPMNIPDSIKQRDGKGNVTYSCKPGYIQIGHISTSSCENGTWTETNMNCFPENSEDCPEPMNIPDSIKQRDGKGNITYSCKPGYMQIGHISTSSCENGTWTETNMNCFPENCGPPPYVPSSRLIVDGYIANFTCESEFLLQGNVSVSICENDTWSDIDIICISKAAIALENRLRQKSKEFQKTIENSHSLICSFLSTEQICRCNNNTATMVYMSHQKIAKHDSTKFTTTSEKECDNFCLQDESCLSSEYSKSKSLCHLSKTKVYFVENKIVMSDENVIYKEKMCVESVHSEQAQEQYPAFNLSTVSPSALLCNIDQQEINCGCIDGRISFKKQIGKKIAMHNMHSFHTNNPLKCFHECEERQNCLSAELKKYKKSCHLSQTAHYLTDENLFVDSPNTLYFEKICKPF